MVNVTPVAKNYIKELKQALDAIDLNDIQKITELLYEAYLSDNTVFILGNGGSASTASHTACDLGKGTLTNVYNPQEKRLRVLSLTDNVACMTAFANDLSYDDMFVQQLHNLVRPGDVVIGISGSGNTPNIIKAFMYAKQMGATTVGFLGYHNGGKAKAFVDYDITIASSNYGIIEDIHMSLDHILTSCLSYIKSHAQDVETKMDNVVIKNKKSRITNSSKSYIGAEWTERSARR